DATADLGLEKVPLDVRVSRIIEGDGFRLHNLVYQSRPGFYMAANLYLPTEFRPPYPAIIINHSHHYPRIQGELQDMGGLWARTGTAVLVVERFGFGERVETTPWYRQAYGSRFNFEKELSLLGESRFIWEAWDIIRGVDLFHERDDIDTDRIIVIGAVASGMQGAAFAGAMDERISATITFNYDQGHVDMSEDLFGKLRHQFSPWLLMASLAPRKYVRAFEFGWEGAETPDYPELYFDGWKRSQKVWGFYDALPNLERSQAYGLIRLSMERVSHCFSVGPQQREDLYPILNRWFNIPFPTQKDLAILPDSELSVNPIREQATKQEAERRLPVDDLLVITPRLASELPRVALHQVLQKRALADLQTARQERARLSVAERGRRLQLSLREILGEINPPDGAFSATPAWSSQASSFAVSAMAVKVEEGIEVPLLLLLPETAKGTRVPVVIGLAEGGKERFLQDGSPLVELLKNGVAVCLPDLRGTGETKPDIDRTDFGAMRSLARTELSLGNTMLGARLKDLRTVIAVLRGREDIDAGRIALWGRSFVPVNDDPLFLDEIQYESGPQIQNWAEPLGAHLALLAALYEPDIRVVAAQNGLVGYLSVLDEAFNYVPYDMIIPGLLKVADMQDVAAALAPRPLLLGPFVNGRNQAVTDLDDWEASIGEGYTDSGLVRFERAFDAHRTARWLIEQLQ
ncbi:MAG TPA: hypothetical protein VKZ59_02385, partial [Acidobacteriota bacterium]|nr:hypothetical protein [Acidobacteriota bacterium]